MLDVCVAEGPSVHGLRCAIHAGVHVLCTIRQPGMCSPRVHRLMNMFLRVHRLIECIVRPMLVCMCCVEPISHTCAHTGPITCC